MERRGSGFKKICNDYSFQQNYREELKPKFYSDEHDFVLTLYNLNNKGNTKSEGIITELHRPVPQSSPKVPQSAVKLPDNLRSFVAKLREFPGATVKQLAEESQTSDRMIKKYLQALKAMGLIERVGSNRKGYWKFIEKAKSR